MAEQKKKKTIKKADGTTATVTAAKPATGNATGYRIGAVIAWIAAIAFEVVAVLILFGKIQILSLPTWGMIIGALVLDLICVIVGSLLWKKSNNIDPASEANKVKFWLWNNMGLIVCAFAFIPFIIIALTDKKADGKTKTIAVVAAVVALLIGSLFGIEWNPISAEEKAEQIAALNSAVYWTQFGTVYHTDPDCSHLNHSDELTMGSVEQAIEANKSRLCKDCEKRGVPENTETEEPVETEDERSLETEADTEEIVIDTAED